MSFWNKLSDNIGFTVAYVMIIDSSVITTVKMLFSTKQAYCF